MSAGVLIFPPEVAARGWRRSLVQKAAAGILGNPTDPVAPGTDSVFAAIFAHRQARAACNASPYGMIRAGDPGEEEAEALDEVLMDREMEALRAVLTARPTTIAGLLALLDYIAEKPFLLDEDGGSARWIPLLAATVRSLIEGKPPRRRRKQSAR